MLALGPIGAHRKQLGMLASPTTKILVFVGDCVDKCGCRGCCGCFGCCLGVERECAVLQEFLISGVLWGYLECIHVSEIIMV